MFHKRKGRWKGRRDERRGGTEKTMSINVGCRDSLGDE